ncbi:hypothetical protein [Tsukamurella sp. 1534]|uniref:hypothetical protein n=1 Tax=Tsukamurella sp. 1534 TaxID=1151061 RepID=UPI0011D1E2B2|nr:hypothetical protein [Tsukamurella sp. 1534]
MSPVRNLVAAVVALAFVGLVAMRFAGALGVLFLGGALVCAVIALLGGTGRGERPARVSAAAPSRPAAAAPPSNRALWERAGSRHDEVLSEYAAYELNPEMLLRFPAMWDLSSPKVMAFHDALEHAGALRTDAYPGDDPGGREAASEYVDAVTDLRTTWYAADRYARSTGSAGLAEEDVKDLDRGLKLYRHASASSSAERAAYLNQVVGTVDRLVDRGVLHAAPRFRAELEAEARKAIEG